MYKITVDIDGMACGMCEAHINDTIRNNFKVKKVTSSHVKNKAEIICNENITLDELRAVIDKTGYTVTSVKSEPYEKHGIASLFKK